MRIFCRFLLFLLIFNLVCDTLARGGGGRGGRGRGRGRSGSRGGMRAKSSVIKSSVRGSSSFNGGVRTGTSGFKVGSSTATSSNYGSSGFRSSVFGPSHHASVHSRGGGHPFVIVAATAPMFYDNRNYYWSYNTAMVNNTVTRTNIICEYVFGNDDGELQNITFKNGSAARAIYFGCQGMVDCCGMYCCHDFHQYFELSFLVGFVLIFLGIAYYAKKHEPYIREPPPNKEKNTKKETFMDTMLLNSKPAKSTGASKPKSKPKVPSTTPAYTKIDMQPKNNSLSAAQTSSNPPAPVQSPQAPPAYGFIGFN